MFTLICFPSAKLINLLVSSKVYFVIIGNYSNFVADYE